jgi:hypothetical protein
VTSSRRAPARAFRAPARAFRAPARAFRALARAFRGLGRGIRIPGPGCVCNPLLARRIPDHGRSRASLASDAVRPVPARLVPGRLPAIPVGHGRVSFEVSIVPGGDGGVPDCLAWTGAEERGAGGMGQSGLRRDVTATRLYAGRCHIAPLPGTASAGSNGGKGLLRHRVPALRLSLHRKRPPGGHRTRSPGGTVRLLQSEYPGAGPRMPVMRLGAWLNQRNVTLRWPGQQRCHIVVVARATSGRCSRDDEATASDDAPTRPRSVPLGAHRPGRYSPSRPILTVPADTHRPGRYSPSRPTLTVRPDTHRPARRSPPGRSPAQAGVDPGGRRPRGGPAAPMTRITGVLFHVNHCLAAASFGAARKARS